MDNLRSNVVMVEPVTLAQIPNNQLTQLNQFDLKDGSSNTQTQSESHQSQSGISKDFKDNDFFLERANSNNDYLEGEEENHFCGTFF